MKSLILGLLLLTVTTQSFAANKSWNCILVNQSDERILESLKLPGYLSTIKVLAIKSKYCSKIGPAIYSDFCVIKSTAIGIGLDPLQSELVTNTGRRVGLICEEDVIMYPQPSHGGSK
ncbi:MAG TPA: hypothetical protein VNJ01_04220 [Bacteriovoracaceae bacterium]|nr:hypothetical protein [Bacteriovoracaceae bacterium]